MWFGVYFVIVNIHVSFCLNQSVLRNKKELEALQTKLQAILLTIEKYKKHDGLGALNHRIDQFCECVQSSCSSYAFDNA